MLPFQIEQVCWYDSKIYSMILWYIQQNHVGYHREAMIQTGAIIDRRMAQRSVKKVPIFSQPNFSVTIIIPLSKFLHQIKWGMINKQKKEYIGIQKAPWYIACWKYNLPSVLWSYKVSVSQEN